MKDLRSSIKDIQRHVGAEVDGIFGPATAAAVLRELRGEDAKAPHPLMNGADDLDTRTLGILATMDPKAVPMFGRFMRLAKATAATLGCDYVLIGGNRTWKEQDALYAQGRTKPGAKVTNAKGGQSNHNFGIAADAGVFLAGAYLDGGNKSQQQLAAKVHRACSEHAATCGLEWGGSWKSLTDLPHYEVATGLTMATKRKLYQAEGSIL
ncbi:M15 family metallopeptidase [Luteolibacter marinus]|uniref:M15 family metallopeptidase n=1 Tax=Luteolibacter marinus TaxID=2776705 RepID=UPI001867971E|nr:M15 family metallopeptidase [Luteolibacter marinus]